MKASINKSKNCKKKGIRSKTKVSSIPKKNKKAVKALASKNCKHVNADVSVAETLNEDSSVEDDNILEIPFNGEESDCSSDDGIQDDTHQQLIRNILMLNNRKRLGAQKEVRTYGGALDSVDTNTVLKKLGSNNFGECIDDVKPLPKPLEKPAELRVKRAAGYESVAVEANKWESIVNFRRKADQLEFPLQATNKKLKQIDSVKQIKPSNKLEADVYSLLQCASIEPEKKESEEEIAIKKAMSLDELRERSRRLWHERELRQKCEKKASMANKIKSKSYHRILRKERLRKEKLEFEQMQKTDPAAAAERLQDMERMRIQERMSLRHKYSKWSLQQGARARTDQTARTALSETERLFKELTEKLQKAEVEDSEDETTATDANSMSMTADQTSETASKGHYSNGSYPKIDPEKFEMVESRYLKSSFPSNFKDNEADLDNVDEEEPEKFILDAFQDDDLIQDFKNEKAEALKEAAPKVSDLVLPGWGSWIGPGIKPKKPRVKRTQVGKAKVKADMKYNKISNVIYNEKSDMHEGIRKVMVSELPFPYTSVKDYEASLRAPLLRQFVPELVHRKMVTPPVVTKMGAVIQPMTDDFLVSAYNALPEETGSTKTRERKKNVKSKVNKRVT